MSITNEQPALPPAQTENGEMLEAGGTFSGRMSATPPNTPGRAINPVASLKRHWLLAAIVAVVVWVGGAPIAWKMGKTTYYTEAVIYVSPRFLKNLESDLEQEMQSNSQYREFVQQQVKTVSRYDILLETLRKNPELMNWWKRGNESEQRSVERLQAALQVKPVPDTYQFTVGLEGEKPRNLAEMTNAVVDNFLRKDKQDELYGKDQRIEDLKAEQERLLQDLAARMEQRTVIAEELGVTTFNEGLVNPYDQLLINSKEALAESRRRRIEKESELVSISPDLSNGQAALTELARELALRDPGLNSLKANLNIRRSELLTKTSGLGPNHPGRKAAESEIGEIDTEIDRKTTELIGSYARMLVEQRKAQVNQMRRSELELDGSVQTQSEQARWFTTKYQEALAHGVEIERLRKRLGAVDDRINFLTLESQAPGFMRLFSSARTPELPLKGGRRKFLLMVLVAGMILAAAIPIAVDYLDPRVHTVNELEKALGLAPLGSVIKIADAGTKQFARDQMWRIAATIDRERRLNGSKVFMLTSAEQGCGATTLTLGLARALAHLGASAIAVEANAFKPDARYTSGGEGIGLAEILRGREKASACIIPANGSLPDRLPVGETGGQRLLPSVPKLGSAIDLLANVYDVILLDAPPPTLSSDTEMLAGLADATILVVGASITRTPQVKQATRHLERLQPAAVGVILNRVDPARDTRTANLMSEQQTGKRLGSARGVASWLWN